jgi:hypothetical protein
MLWMASVSQKKEKSARLAEIGVKNNCSARFVDGALGIRVLVLSMRISSSPRRVAGRKRYLR